MAFLDKYPRVQALFNIRTKPVQYGGPGWESRGDIAAFHHGYDPIFTVSYNGEKSQGNIGLGTTRFIKHTSPMQSKS